MTAQEGMPPGAAKKGGGILKVFLVLILLVAAFLGGAYFGGPLLGVGGGGEPGPTKIIVGTNTPYPPFERRNASADEFVLNGQIEGFDIDLITEILRRMGYDRGTEWDLWDFRDFTGGLLPALQAGRVDIAVSGITITDARNATMDFSDTYYESDNDCQPADIEAAAGGAYVVAVQTGTTSDCWVTASCWGSANLPGATVQRYPDITDAVIALQAGSAAMVIMDGPAAVGFAAANPTVFAVGGTIQTNELLGFAVGNNDPLGLIPGIDQALAAMRADGKYDEILNKWF